MGVEGGERMRFVRVEERFTTVTLGSSTFFMMMALSSSSS